MNNRRVTVLLSFYKGFEHIAEQLRSISKQQDVLVHVEVRIDGEDKTSRDLLEELIHDLNLSASIHSGPNLGFVESFCWLVKNCKVESDYYAFCDQDDFWRPEKLSNAVDAIQSCSAPLSDMGVLHICGALVVDKDLNPIKELCIPEMPSIGACLCENYFPGHLMVFDRNLLFRARAVEAKRILAHDWFFLLLAVSSGHLIVDKSKVDVWYRQHGGNVLGSPSFFATIQRKLKSVIQGRPRLATNRSQALEILRLTGGTVNRLSRSRLVEFCGDTTLSLRGRLMAACSGRFRRSNRLDDALFRIQMILGYY